MTAVLHVLIVPHGMNIHVRSASGKHQESSKGPQTVAHPSRTDAHVPWGLIRIVDAGSFSLVDNSRKM